MTTDPTSVFDTESPAAADALSGTSVASGRLVLVTGPSGAGRSTAIAAFEDLGFEAIDNLPLTLLPRLLAGPLRRPLVLGLDVRNRDFSTEALIDVMDLVSGLPGLNSDMLFLDARADVLLRRYSETRRRHPLAPAETPETGIERETDLLRAARARADIMIDTSEMTPHELRAELGRWFATGDGPGLTVSVHSFSYKRGLPRGADMIFDVRFLQNPYWQRELRALTGLDPRVSDHVAADARFQDFFGRIRDLTLTLLPAYAEEGKTHLAIAFGCTGGQHRSVAVAERLANALAEAGWRVSTRHREMERRAITDAAPQSGTGP
ncbi:RNase adapter RapZ [Mesobaculum littorinae]|uniref:RNase adapter RapZ n=1 Tax=Mesobaculum littorinae TaxID=2486419 RepID=A0A438AFX4_9RHOB|nr:RNase adapter RapZ [Mesobaculum littorinae]RVV97507.1 RNase adapter RapZ [Mesobaculum littorinae]